MSKEHRQLVFFLLAFTIVGGCGRPPTPAPVPSAPDIFSMLPHQAKIQCFGDPSLDELGRVYIFSIPGRRQPDPDSGASGYNGREIGLLENCESVSIIDYSWDPWDAEFWVKISNDELDGWLKLNLLTVDR